MQQTHGRDYVTYLQRRIQKLKGDIERVQRDPNATLGETADHGHDDPIGLHGAALRCFVRALQLVLTSKQVISQVAQTLRGIGQ